MKKDILSQEKTVLQIFRESLLQGMERSKNLRQVVTAVSDGANCVYSVERYLQNA